jgi:hypothetical protein
MKKSVDIDHPLVFEWLVTKRLQMLFSTSISPREALPEFFNVITPFPVCRFLPTSTKKTSGAQTCGRFARRKLLLLRRRSEAAASFKDIRFQIFSKCENFPKVTDNVGRYSLWTILPEDAVLSLLHYECCTIKPLAKSKSPNVMFKTLFDGGGDRQLLLMIAVKCSYSSKMSLDESYDELSKANPLCDERTYNVLLICSSRYEKRVNEKFDGNNTLMIVSELKNLHEVYLLKLENDGYASFFGKDTNVLETIRAVITKSNQT